jgi:hypothetical protein
VSDLSQFFPVGNPSIPVFFGSSASFTVPATGWYRISALGPGGSGGAIFATASGGSASGGEGGGFCEKEIYLIAGDVLTIVIGAGGAGVVSSITGVGVAGNPGGAATTVVCVARSLSLSAGPGNGGNFTITNAATVNGGTGGSTSTGGDVNYTGGRGGNANHVTLNVEAAGGGGSGSPYGNGGKGGDQIGPGTLGATGGGSIRFSGGNITNTLTPTNTGGGGTGGPGVDNTATAGVNMLGGGIVVSIDGVNRSSSGTPCFDSLFNPFRALTGGGTDGGQVAASSRNTGPGAGTGAPSAFANTNTAPTIGGGTGGCALAAKSGSVNAGRGGGSGGAASSATGPATSGNGGSGLVTVERIG